MRITLPSPLTKSVTPTVLLAKSDARGAASFKVSEEKFPLQRLVWLTSSERIKNAPPGLQKSLFIRSIKCAANL